MSFKSTFDRVCNELDVIYAAGNALMSKRFDNEPEKVVALNQLAHAAIERLERNARHSGVELTEQIKKHEPRYQVMRLVRARWVKEQNERKAELELMRQQADANVDVALVA